MDAFAFVVVKFVGLRGGGRRRREGEGTGAGVIEPPSAVEGPALSSSTTGA